MDRQEAEVMALVVEAKVIDARIQGMVAENQHHVMFGRQVIYREDAFNEQARTLEFIASRIRSAY